MLKMGRKEGVLTNSLKRFLTKTPGTEKHKVNPFAPGDFAEKRVLKLVEWFSGHRRAIKS